MQKGISLQHKYQDPVSMSSSQILRPKMLGIPALAQPSPFVGAEKSQENESSISTSTSIYISIYLSISIPLPDEIPVPR